jgi:hypothetical protein
VTDGADKSWLRGQGYDARRLARMSSAFAFLVGLAAIVAALHVWGVWVGERSAQLRSDEEKREAIAICAEEHAIAYVEQSTGALICARGSTRIAPKAQKGQKE